MKGEMHVFKVVLPEVLSKEEETLCLRAIKEGKKEAKDKLIEHNLRLVHYIAQRYQSTIVEKEDLISIGTIGIIKAANSYDLDKNIKFATYASRCIENEILMYLRKYNKLQKNISMDQGISFDKEGNELAIQDILRSDKEEVEEEIMRRTTTQLIRAIVDKLPEMEKKIIMFRYGICCHRKNQQDIAEMLNISQSYVSRIEGKILGKLKRAYEKAII